MTNSVLVYMTELSLNLERKFTPYTLCTEKIEFDFILTHLFPMHPSSAHLKTSENLTVFRCFQGVEKECVGNEWVN